MSRDDGYYSGDGRSIRDVTDEEAWYEGERWAIECALELARIEQIPGPRLPKFAGRDFMDDFDSQLDCHLWCVLEIAIDESEDPDASETVQTKLGGVGS